MHEQGLDSTLAALEARRLPDGGFPGVVGRGYRPEATAWVALAFAAAGHNPHLVNAARARLAQGQSGDGRIPIDADEPNAFWPTPLAILAWHGDPRYAPQEESAVRFLLTTAGQTLPRSAEFPAADDTTLIGWPWVAGCYSWVEPTSLAVIALRHGGKGDADRVREAVRLLLDRQLPDGGWNYGNTVVFGKQLAPMPLSTGMALNALAGLVPREAVEKSIDHLREEMTRVRTPLSLGWGLLGLGAWGDRPGSTSGWVLDSLERQAVYGLYETSMLALMVVAYFAKRGLMGPALEGNP